MQVDLLNHKDLKVQIKDKDYRNSNKGILNRVLTVMVQEVREDRWDQKE